MVKSTYPYKRWIRPKFLSLKYRYKYGSVPDPYGLITVDTNNINHITFPKFSQEFGTYGTHIVGGDWDQRVTEKSIFYSNSREDVLSRRHLLPLENYKLYLALKDRFVHDKDWKDTEFYQWAIDNLEGTDSYYDITVIDDRLSFLDELFHDMRDEGYATQQELLTNQNISFKSYFRIPERQEVMISIGRDGRMAVDEGRHRFMIAKILGLEIPVRVLARHEQWYKKRELVKSGEVDYSNHPDLRNLA